MFKHNKFVSSNKGFASSNYDVAETVIGLKLLENVRLTQFQIEAARVVIRRRLKRKGTLVLCIFPFLQLTKKPLAVRMGKGKGNSSFKVCPLPKGKIIFVIQGVASNLAKEALLLGGFKISKRFRIIEYKQ